MAEVDETTAPWPAHWEADVVTADGGTVHVRPITPGDGDRLVAFHGRQSPESVYFRFFSARPTLPAADVHRFTNVDGRDRAAFVALLDDDLVGVGRYDRFKESDEAEVAFFIDDAHHGRGLATILLEYLAAAARDHGITAFVATVLPGNRKMLGVFTGAGFETASRFADGIVEVRFEITPTAASMAAIEERASRAEARTVARLLEPRTVAVIGAGRTPGSMGHEVLRQLLGHGFAGPVYPVNREASHVASVRAWPSILDVPDHVDLAVIAVPSAEVLDAVEECARAHVGALIVVSTGFAEAGPEGLERAKSLVALAHRHGIRLLGPGSMGVINTSPEVRLHASFVPESPRPGGIALSLQSGTLGAGIIRRANAQGVGFSALVAVGDKFDISGNDLLAWWDTDDRTDVIAMSLASYGNPRRFRRLAPRVARRKPIVAVLREPQPDDVPLLAQTGVVGVSTMEEMLDVARVLAWQPVPQGDRVAVVADSAGSGDFAAAALRAAGLQAVTVVAVGADAEPAAYEQAVADALGDEATAVDAVLAVYAAAIAPRPEDVARAVAAGASGSAKTVVASFPGHDLGGGLPETGGRRIPDLAFPDTAARALAAAVRYGTWRRRPLGVVPAFDELDLTGARALVARCLDTSGPGRLGLGEGVALLAAAGASVVTQRFVPTKEAARAACTELGVPVALKAVGRPPVAKSEGAGVALDLQDEADLSASWDRMASALGPAMTGGVVQVMVPPGTDVRVVLEPADVVGAAVGLGVGGANPDLLVPVARSVLPLTDVAAADLIARSGLGALLTDADAVGLADLLLRVSHLAEELPEVTWLALNPVIVTGGTAWVVDAKVEVVAHPLDHPDDLRRLGS